MTFEQIKSIAMALPPSARESLGNDLLTSLPISKAEATALVESKRRSDELQKDPSGGLSREQLIASLDKRVGR